MVRRVTVRFFTPRQTISWNQPLTCRQVITNQSDWPHVRHSHLQLCHELFLRVDCLRKWTHKTQLHWRRNNWSHTLRPPSIDYVHCRQQSILRLKLSQQWTSPVKSFSRSDRSEACFPTASTCITMPYCDHLALWSGDVELMMSNESLFSLPNHLQSGAKSESSATVSCKYNQELIHFALAEDRRPNAILLRLPLQLAPTDTVA